MPPRAPSTTRRSSRTQRAPALAAVSEHQPLGDRDHDMLSSSSQPCSPMSSTSYYSETEFATRFGPRPPVSHFYSPFDSTPGTATSSIYSYESDTSSLASNSSASLKRRAHIRRPSRSKATPVPPLPLSAPPPTLDFQLPVINSPFLPDFASYGQSPVHRTFPARGPTEATPILTEPPFPLPKPGTPWSLDDHASSSGTLDWGGLDSLMGCGSNLQLMEMYKQRYGIEFGAPPVRPQQ